MPRRKASNIGTFHRNKEIIEEMKTTAAEQLKEINRLEKLLQRRKRKISELKDQINIQDAVVKRRKINPSSINMSHSTQIRRREETMKFAQVVHGGSDDNIDPITYGLTDFLAARMKAGAFSELVLSRPKWKNAICKQLQKGKGKKKKDAYNSDKNMKRSCANYYSYVVLGKRKYEHLCRSNKKSDRTKLVHYKKLAA